MKLEGCVVEWVSEVPALLGRYDAHSGGEREIQRTMLELLNQLDGFDARADVKVILATNRIESLDPALLRPGRIDRKIEFPLPDIKTKRRIFQVIILHPQKFGVCTVCLERNSICSAFVLVLDGLWCRLLHATFYSLTDVVQWLLCPGLLCCFVSQAALV